MRLNVLTTLLILSSFSLCAQNNLGRAHLGDLQNETWESVIQKIEEYPFISNIKVWED